MKKISEKSYLNVGWSIITTKDDETRQLVESRAPPVKSRFEAMRQLADAGIITGTVFMPILPFIYDDEENIESVVRETKERGGQYVLDAGLTLWGYCKTHYYKALEKHDPNLVKKYDELYGNAALLGEHEKHIHEAVLKHCQKYNLTNFIPRPVSFYPKGLRTNKEIAARFYLEARDLMMTGQKGYREWAYRKAAWALDDAKQSVENIYKEKGIKGLMEIKGIGEKLARKVEDCLRQRRG
jgi:hypothetical protein